MPTWLAPSETGSKLYLHIVPGASKTEMSGEYNGQLKIKLKAIPQDGEANDCLIEFLAKTLKISKKKIHLLSGGKSRQKVLFIDLTPDIVVTLLSY